MPIHPSPPVPSLRLAVLIDAETLSGAHAPQLMKLARQLGRPIIRRAYGDWTTSRLDLWKQHLHPLAIWPHQHFRYRRCKNASDAALIMDAMELLCLRRADAFCIVSSNSGFAGLAARIQARGVPVYGFGQRDTAHAFIAACNRFMYPDQAEQTR
ncbi:MAG: NYN domain-containing protein [Hydrogenophaga sp.]|uniref:NYN domain-containing protein n=1 Tax=Hydrogenophaga sp. TaxID=1904254 RepID=UPI0025C2676E|nr:NYN domain-containing protein [Hydrogenophaga sp.]MBU7574430.1 NYN domain-containing protein [Hydrogenophaga sp.]